MINKELLEKVCKLIDDAIDFKKIFGGKLIGTIAEKLDYFVISYGVKYLNETYGDNIPDIIVKNIEGISQMLIDGDFDGVIKYQTEAIDNLVDIKALEDDLEAQFIAVNLEAFIKFVKYYALKRR